MFTGAVPKAAIEQITRIVPFDEWGKVFVGCSGTFRFERAVKQWFPDVAVHSNDVSLLSCALGAAAVNEPFSIEFRDRLAFVEPHLEGRAFVDRAAAVLVALDMANFKGANQHAIAHFDHYVRNFPAFLDSARAKVDGWLDGLKLESFRAGDFLAQARRAAEEGGGIAAFPPTYKGGYERLYKFLSENTSWPEPDYGVWDPDDLEDWVCRLSAEGIRHCVISDRRLERVDPVSVYRTATNRPLYAYADRSKSSVRISRHRAVPFRYKPLDVKALRPKSTVQIVPAPVEHLNFLKNKYLSKGIAHTPGEENFLVFLDGMLAGGFIFSRRKGGDQSCIYLLCDFALVRSHRVSKLVAALSTCATVIRRLEAKYVTHITSVATSAFTDKPVSMKYRGVFKLASRKPGFLEYVSEIREESPQRIYRQWYRRQVRDADRPSQAA